MEDPKLQLDLVGRNVTKVLAIYSLHHLPDTLKKQCLEQVIALHLNVERIVVGDLIFFEDPSLHRGKFDDIHYDGGETDFPATIAFFQKLFNKYNAPILEDRFHPLCGVISADFTTSQK